MSPQIKTLDDILRHGRTSTGSTRFERLDVEFWTPQGPFVFLIGRGDGQPNSFCSFTLVQCPSESRLIGLLGLTRTFEEWVVGNLLAGLLTVRTTFDYAGEQATVEFGYDYDGEYLDCLVELSRTLCRVRCRETIEFFEQALKQPELLPVLMDRMQDLASP